jgi:exodeoxyribonuclease VII small subunit
LLRSFVLKILARRRCRDEAGGARVEPRHHAATLDARARGSQASFAMGDKVEQESALTFEQSVKRLSEIVTALEKGDLPLEDSLKLFEEGVKLSRASQDKLDAAQKRVEELLGFERDGRPRTQAFDTTKE